MGILNITEDIIREISQQISCILEIGNVLRFIDSNL